MDLTDRDKEMLTLAGTWFASGGYQDAAIRDRWDISSVAFWARVRWLLEQPEAEAWDAQLVNRLKRLGARRRWARSGQRLASGTEPRTKRTS